MTSKKYLYAAVIIAIVVIGIIAYYYYNNIFLPSQEELVIKVGVPASYTGVGAEQSKSIKSAIELLVGEINAEGGLLVGGKRYRLEPYWADDECKPDVGKAVIEKLVTVEGIDVAIGHFCSGAFITEMDVYQAHGVPAVTACSASVDITRKIADNRMDYVFQLSPTLKEISQDNSAVLWHYLFETIPEPRKLAFLMWDDPAGRTEVEFGLAWLEANAPSVEVVLTEFVPLGTSEFSAVLSKIKASGAQAVFLDMGGEPAKALAQQWYELKMPFLMLDSQPIPEDFLQQNLHIFEGWVLNNRWWPGPHTPKTLPFMDSYKQKFGEDPNNWAVQTYDSGLVMFEAIKLAGTVDKAAIRDALERVDIDAVWGHRKFRSIEEGHTMPTNTVLYQIQNGEKVVIYPLEFAKEVGPATWLPVPPQSGGKWAWELAS